MVQNLILVKWKDSILMCNIIKSFEPFRKLYVKEIFKYGDLEEIRACNHNILLKNL